MLSQQGRRAPRRGAQGGDGEQPARRALRRAGGPADRQHRDHPPVDEPHVADRKSFLLRIDAGRARGGAAVGERRPAQPECVY